MSSICCREFLVRMDKSISSIFDLFDRIKDIEEFKANVTECKR